jgi:acyl carrier protein
MERAEIESTIRDIVVRALRVKPDRVTPEARLFADLGAESIDMIDIRFNVETAFKIKIGDYEIERSLGDSVTAQQIAEKLSMSSVCDFVEWRLGEARTSAKTVP